MALLRLLIWLLLFLGATFCWVVVFEHGFSGFAEGFREEWQNLKEALDKS